MEEPRAGKRKSSSQDRGLDLTSRATKQTKARNKKVTSQSPGGDSAPGRPGGCVEERTSAEGTGENLCLAFPSGLGPPSVHLPFGRRDQNRAESTGRRSLLWKVRRPGPAAVTLSPGQVSTLAHGHSRGSGSQTGAWGQPELLCCAGTDSS